MYLEHIADKALSGKDLELGEIVELYTYYPPNKLLSLANDIRFYVIPKREVSWQIDRNVNYTNVCISGCTFCNFHCRLSQKDRAFTTTPREYKAKIEEMVSMGGDQLLLQGGLHPHYDITFFESLFGLIKGIMPEIKLNALGPPEIHHIAKISKISVEETLSRLIKAGLTTLPGAGAEILSDRVRKIISPGKPGTNEWLSVMECAHSLGIGTTATMVYGHIETVEERIRHLLLLRELQKRKGDTNPGFRAFICWPMQTKGTKLAQQFNLKNPSSLEHLKMIAISRIALNNIPHIQVSWLTIGTELAKIALHCGADDMGSVMIEENVVSSAGASFRLTPQEMERVIKDAGFDPWLRSQEYTRRSLQ